jgi:sulfite reductase beta subunit-like hemoprotein
MENWLIKPNSCPGLFYGTSAQDGFLIRLRVPGGILTQPQAEAIADWVETQAEENCRYSDYWFSIRIVVLQLRGMLTKSVVLDLF